MERDTSITNFRGDSHIISGGKLTDQSATVLAARNVQSTAETGTIQPATGRTSALDATTDHVESGIRAPGIEFENVMKLKRIVNLSMTSSHHIQLALSRIVRLGMLMSRLIEGPFHPPPREHTGTHCWNQLDLEDFHPGMFKARLIEEPFHLPPREHTGTHCWNQLDLEDFYPGMFKARLLEEPFHQPRIKPGKGTETPW